MAGEGQRCRTTLLLAHAVDHMIARIIDGQAPAFANGQSSRRGEDRIGAVVLTADAGGMTELLRPGRIAARSSLRGDFPVLQGLRQRKTQLIDRCLQAMVEHVADHGHSAQHPLAAAAEFGDVELRHTALPAPHGLKHRGHRIVAEAEFAG